MAEFAPVLRRLASDLSQYSVRQLPSITMADGRFCRLEAISEYHRDGLYEASIAHGAETRFKYLPESVPRDKDDFNGWFNKALVSTDPKFYAVICKRTGKVGGRLSLMRLTPEHGVIEVGNIHFSPLIARSSVSTEAIYLAARYIFDDLHYRRLEWKCDNLNEPSKRSALRYGFTFEGVFRQHMIIKGRNRDTAWFSMISKEWPILQAAFETWLDPANYDQDGVQLRSLCDIRKEIIEQQGDNIEQP